MPIQSRRVVAGATVAAFGGVSLAWLAPVLGAVAESTLCLSLSPAQSWVGLQMHVIAESSACAQGGYLGTEHLMPALSFSVMVSVTTVLVGLALLGVGVGGGVTVRALLRRVGAWLRQLWLPQVSGWLPTPSLVPVPVRGRRQHAELAHQPSQRRGPPGFSC